MCLCLPSPYSILSPPLCSAPAVCGEGGAGSGHQHNRSFKRVKLVLWIISGGSRAGPKITTNKGREQINKTQQRHKRSMYRVSSKTVYTWFLLFFSSKSNPILTSRVSFEN